MCGRYTLTVDAEPLKNNFNLAHCKLDYKPRYNIAPTQGVPVIIERDNNREALLMRWGLIPHWAKDASFSHKMINARAETIETKPAFKDSFRKRRCLIPADSFYEWKEEKGSKRPFRITLVDKKIFAFAGIWDSWISPQGEEVLSCSIITTQANSFMKQLHHRMPVILANSEQQSKWLTVNSNDQLKSLLIPYQGEMVCYSVGKLINSPQNDTPQCIERA